MQRQLRLRRSADFEHVKAHGRQWHHPFLVMTVTPNALAQNRYGFVASRRLGSAVVRNRVRRLLRESVRHATPRLKPGYDLVFVARNAILNKTYWEICKAMQDVLQRAGLWREGN